MFLAGSPGPKIRTRATPMLEWVKPLSAIAYRAVGFGTVTFLLAMALSGLLLAEYSADAKPRGLFLAGAGIGGLLVFSWLSSGQVRAGVMLAAKSLAAIAFLAVGLYIAATLSLYTEWSREVRLLVGVIAALLLIVVLDRGWHAMLRTVALSLNWLLGKEDTRQKNLADQ